MKSILELQTEIQAKELKIKNIEIEIKDLNSQRASIINKYVETVQKYWEAAGIKLHPHAGLGIQTDVYNLSFIFDEEHGFKLNGIKIRNRRKLAEEDVSDNGREISTNVVSLSFRFISADPQLERPDQFASEVLKMNDEINETLA